MASLPPASLRVGKSVPGSVANPVMDTEINIMGLLNLLKLGSEYGVRKFIFISSGGAISSDAEGLPSKEDCTPSQESPYAISKLASENYVKYFASASEMKYTILRYANVYGPGQSECGECGVIPIFFNNILTDKLSLLYTFSDMPDGTTRDYVYVEDVVKANYNALEMGDGQVMNIGSGKETYTRYLYEKMLVVCGKKLPLIPAEPRKGDIRRSVLDTTRADRFLEWTPTVSLEEGIALTYKWLVSGKTNQISTRPC